jgi:prepilin-type N-terminal cleavage/methylation domain-containing protein/prepilin-type processing-associated H-X9-DG protein
MTFPKFQFAVGEPRGGRRAFTLIELLVVVAIIGLLIAILLPSLGRARDKAKTSACLSNVKQLCLSYIMYTSDQTNGINILSPSSLGGSNWVTATLPYHSSDVKVYNCPVATTPAPKSFQKAAGDGWGSRTMAWNGDWVSGSGNNYWKAVDPFHTAPDGNYYYLGTTTEITSSSSIGAVAGTGYRGGYTFNSWLFNKPGSTSYIPAAKYGGDGVGMNIYSRIEQQSSTPVFADGMWMDTNTGGGVLPTDCVKLPGNLNGGESNPDGIANSDSTTGPVLSAGVPSGTGGSGNSNASWRLWVSRHGNKTTNLAYADGSAANIKLADFYNQTWFNGWIGLAGAAAGNAAATPGNFQATLQACPP